MKKISAWAKAHSWPARFVIVLLHFILIAAAIFIGRSLSGLSVYISAAYIWFAILLYIAAVLIYPNSKAKHSPRWISHYAFQKSCDFMLTATGLFMICFLANRPANQPIRLNPLSGAHPVVYNNQHPSTIKSNIEEKKPGNHILSRKERKALLKELKLELREVFKAKPGRARQIALTILVGLVAIVLLALVGALSCDLSCSGNEGAALFVMILGTAGVVALVLFFVKRINASYRRRVPDQRTERR
jgi:hypothetical protein